MMHSQPYNNDHNPFSFSINRNPYTNSFIISSKAYSNQIGDGGFAIPAQTFITDDEPGTVN